MKTAKRVPIIIYSVTVAHWLLTGSKVYLLGVFYSHNKRPELSVFFSVSPRFEGIQRSEVLRSTFLKFKPKVQPTKTPFAAVPSKQDILAVSNVCTRKKNWKIERDNSNNPSK